MTARTSRLSLKVGVLLILQGAYLVYSAKAQGTDSLAVQGPPTDPEAIATALAQFIVMATLFLGGPLGVIYSLLEKKALKALGSETYVKGCLMTIAGLLCFAFALVIGSDLSLYYISTAVPGVVGGASIFKTGTGQVTTSAAAMKAKRDDNQPPSDGGNP